MKANEVHDKVKFQHCARTEQPLPYASTPGPWFHDCGQVLDQQSRVIATRHANKESLSRVEDSYPTIKGIKPYEADSNNFLMSKAPEMRQLLADLLYQIAECDDIRANDCEPDMSEVFWLAGNLRLSTINQALELLAAIDTYEMGAD